MAEIANLMITHNIASLIGIQLELVLEDVDEFVLARIVLFNLIHGGSS